MKTRAILVGICAAATLLAQAPPPGRGFGRMSAGGPGRGPGGMGMGMGMGRGGAMERPVTGAPYSAVEVTQTTQTLANGNVITQTRQTTVYRDSQGRVRTETTMPLRPGQTGQARTLISIHDPVAGVSRELDPQSKTVREMPMRNFAGQGNFPRGNTQGTLPGRGRTDAATARRETNTVNETLPAQAINGVMATGARETHTIPAGEIGNAAAIQTVRETWYSPDLKVPVMTRLSDPRTGTIVTQLTNIVRAEPDASLFQAPTDYTVVRGERGPNGMPGPMRGRPANQ